MLLPIDVTVDFDSESAITLVRAGSTEAKIEFAIFTSFMVAIGCVVARMSAPPRAVLSAKVELAINASDTCSTSLA